MKNFTKIFVKFKSLLLLGAGVVFFKIKYPDTKWLRPKKLGSFYSQEGQDLYLTSLLFNALVKRPELNWVVDVGCNHPSIFSNSLIFEQLFNCRVIAIDAIEEFSEQWQTLRPAAKFVASAVGDSCGTISLNVPDLAGFESMFSYVENGVNKRSDLTFRTRIVKLTRLQNIFEQYSINEILLLSIDIEGGELSALRGIDFENVLIKCIILENNSKSLFGCDDLRSFLTDLGYIFYARLGYLDDVFLHPSMVNGAEFVRAS